MTAQEYQEPAYQFSHLNLLLTHAGLTNAFLIASENPLALRYNDTAPLGEV